MAKVLTLGEIMLRLQPSGYKRIAQATELEMCFGGGEANVAVSLAQMDVPTAFCTKLPKNELGDSCLRELRRWGVETSFIARGGDRLGIYFCEKGVSQRPSRIIYDRANSSVTTISEEDIDIDKMLNDVSWVHFTGITPALGDAVALFLEKVLKQAKEKGISISCDLNYRKKLWSREKANKVMSGLMKYVDLLISNEEDCKNIFGIEASGADIYGGELTVDGYIDVAKKIKSMFNINKCAFTLRESLSASINNWSGILVENGQLYQSRKYTINVVDRVGGGDSFGAGLIYGMLNKVDRQEIIEYAVAASALKHSIEGDFNVSTVDEIEQLVKGDGSGRVQR
ncbi:MAG: sugar kinase [Clostridia bacterium]